MKRGFPGKGADNAAAVTALASLLAQARTLDHFTPESLARSYNVPVMRVTQMLADAKRGRG